MKIIPLIRCRDMEKSIFFYTHVLDFELKDPGDTSEVRNLVKEDIEIQLSSFDGIFGIAFNIRVDDLDGLFKKFVSRGLNTDYPNSPVHRGPLDQDWGMREFYVTDPDGNTLRFGKSIE